MRRISLSLALIGAVAATGCGKTSTSNTGGNKGTAGTFTVTVQNGQAPNTGLAIKNGYVTSNVGGIDCGSGTGHAACSATLTQGTTVALTAHPDTSVDAGMKLLGWAGDCAGDAACTLTVNVDKYVVVTFGTEADRTWHPNWSLGSVHGPKYVDFVNGAPGALQCTKCHGATLSGLGIAPSCGLCHPRPANFPGYTPPATTGLQAIINGITLGNGGTPVTVQFTLKDKTGAPVDLAGVYSNNLPLSNCGYPTFFPSQGCSNTTIGFAVGYWTYDTSGNVLPWTIYTKSQGNPTMLSPVRLNDPSATTKGVLTADPVVKGNYTYTFPATVVIDQVNHINDVHSLLMFASRQEDTTFACITAATGTNPFTFCNPNADDPKTFSAVNLQQSFDPLDGTLLTDPIREVVKAENCDKCHSGFKPEGAVSAAFHSGSKVAGWICNVCHNPARNPTTITAASPDSAQFVHRIHSFKEAGLPAQVCLNASGAVIKDTGTPPKAITDLAACTAASGTMYDVAFHGLGTELTYPQDLRNCSECHGGAQQGNQWSTRATPVACNSCHDATYWFASQAALDGELAGFGPGPSPSANVQWYHALLEAPESTNCLAQNNGTGCNNNTNAGWLPAAGVDVTKFGATAITYEIQSVGLDANGKPTMTFRFLKNGAAAALDSCPKAGNAGAATPTPYADVFGTSGFVGAPSLYWAFAVSQDGITAPADWNATQSVYVKAVCNTGKTAFSSTAVVATISAPDANKYYTVTVTGTVDLSAVGANVKMLTGGVGYTYGLQATQPLTQVNLPALPSSGYGKTPPGMDLSATTATITAGKINNVDCTVPANAAQCTVKLGGLVNVAANKWMTATGYTPRRTIVDNAKCKNCHGALGAKPSFHAGNRNDGPTCAFCHNAQQNNSGWSGNTKDFVHGLHVGTAAGVRLPDGVSTSPGTGFRTTPFGWHAVSTTEGYWDVTFPSRRNECLACHVPGSFDFSVTTSAANMLWSTEASGTSALAASATNSPYVTAGTTYGAGFSFSAGTGATTAPALTTLVTSPIAAACFACHDSASAKAHMEQNGAAIYKARSAAGGATLVANETCLSCHGPAAGWPISAAHK